MNYILKILYHLSLFNWIVAEVAYLHTSSYTEVIPPDGNKGTDFGYSLGYSSKKRSLVIGAPHHDLNGKVFNCSMEGAFINKTAESTEIHIDIDELAGDYSRELAPDHNFCLGSSISVASDFILTCAPLWRTVRNDSSLLKFKYGIYGACFVVTDDGPRRFKGIYEQLSDKGWKNDFIPMLTKVHSGTGWSTLIDEVNNITLMSLSPFGGTADIGYTKTVPTLGSLNFMNAYRDINADFKNIGSFTKGVFFEDKLVTYAFSSRRENMIGLVGFLQEPTKPKNVWEVMKKTGGSINLFVKASKSETGSMFGAAVSSCDLNLNGFSDLLVGAPAQGKIHYNSGALHIFLGGNKAKIQERRTIESVKPGGYFGRTIATIDVDGDGYSEIFVSAPFEDAGNGAVYVINGLEVKNFVTNNKPDTVIKLTDLKLTQRIQNTKYKSFGYSLQPLADVDGKGQTALAVGAPNSGKVLLFRSLSTVNVTLSAKLDRDYIRERDRNCTILLNIDVISMLKLELITEPLTVTMKIAGNDVIISEVDGIVRTTDGKYSFTQTIACNQTYSKSITVIFTNEQPGLYVFTAEVAANNDKYLENEVFNKSKVTIRPYSETAVRVQINRQCRNEDCVPILSSSIKFSGGDNHYLLGSSTTETVAVTISNRGSDTYDSCIKIIIIGSEVLYTVAEKVSVNVYQYKLPQPFVRNKSRTIDVQLDMKKHTNSDKKLQVNVELYNVCNGRNFTVNEKVIPFALSTKEIYIDTFYIQRNITKSEILDPKINSITTNHIYTVINNGSLTWKSITAKIKITKKYFINASISTLGLLHSSKTQDNDTALFTCSFDLKDFFRFVITFDIVKNMIEENLENDQFNISSNFELYLESNDNIKENQITTTFYYIKYVSFGQNKTLIIIISIILSIIILLGLSFVLYKKGFFKNPEKIELEKMKDEIHKQSVRRRNTVECLTIPNFSEENIEGQQSNETRDGHEMIEGHETIEEHETSKGYNTSEGHETTEGL